MMEGLRSIIMELLLKFIFSFLNFFRYIYDIQRRIIVTIFWIFINRTQRLELFECARMSKCFSFDEKNDTSICYKNNDKRIFY